MYLRVATAGLMSIMLCFLLSAIRHSGAHYHIPPCRCAWIHSLPKMVSSSKVRKRLVLKLLAGSDYGRVRPSLSEARSVGKRVSDIAIFRMRTCRDTYAA